MVVWTWDVVSKICQTTTLAHHITVWYVWIGGGGTWVTTHARLCYLRQEFLIALYTTRSTAIPATGNQCGVIAGLWPPTWYRCFLLTYPTRYLATFWAEPNPRSACQQTEPCTPKTLFNPFTCHPCNRKAICFSKIFVNFPDLHELQTCPPLNNSMRVQNISQFVLLPFLQHGGNVLFLLHYYHPRVIHVNQHALKVIWQLPWLARTPDMPTLLNNTMYVQNCEHEGNVLLQQDNACP